MCNILIFCVLNTINDFIMHAHYCRSFGNNMKYMQLYVPTIPSHNFLLIRVAVFKFLIVFFIDTLCLFVRIYDILLGCLLKKFIGDIEV